MFFYHVRFRKIYQSGILFPLSLFTKICSEKHLREEIEYPTDIFCENGHDRKTLQNMINSFEKETRGTNNNNNDSNNNNTNNSNEKRKVTIPWVPKIGPKIKEKHKNLGLE